MDDSSRSRITDWLALVSIARPRRTLTLWATLAAVSTLGGLDLRIDTSTSSFLDRGHAKWDLYQESLQEFGGDEFLTVAIEGEVPWDRDALNRVYDLAAELENLPDVRRIDSLRSVPLISSDAQGDLSLTAALAGGVPETSESLARLAARVSRDRLAPGNLVSKDGRVFAVNALFEKDVDGRRSAAVAQVEALLEGDRTWISGVPVFRTKVNERTAAELTVFVPATLALVGLVIFAAYRSLWAVAVAFGTSAIGTALALGMMGVTGAPVSLSTAVLPSTLLALGCAYVMHILSAAQGASSREQLSDAVRSVALPIAMSGLTTVIGFLAMATVRISAIRELATYGAIGVFGVTAAALSFAPAVLSLRPLHDRGTGAEWFRKHLHGFVLRIVVEHGGVVLITWAMLAGVFFAGISSLRIETDIVLWFSRGTEIRESYEAIRSRISGITPVNVVVRSKEGRSVTEPEVLGAIDELTAFLAQRPEIGRAISVTDPLRQTHGVFHDGERGLPNSQAMTEQYLLLLSSVDELRDVISDDRSAANILLRVDVNGSQKIVAVAELIDEWWGKNGPADFSADTTGIMYEFARAEEEIAYGQIRGLSLAFLAIAGVLLAMLRSFPATLGALIPNVLPLMAAYGFLGLLDVPLDAATVCVGCIALGIAVDDTVHLVTAFRAGRKSGADDREAVSFAIGRVLPPVVLTTLAIGFGFLVLGYSEFTLIRHFGFVTTGMVSLCLIADLTLLPVLLLRRGRS